MSNQPSALNLILSRGNTKRDSTRILSNLSGDSRVVPARAKSALSRTLSSNKIFAALAALMLLAGLAAWSARYMQRAATPSSSATIKPEAPAQTVPDVTASVLPALSESQAALIENMPDNVRKNDVTSEKPVAALTEGVTPLAKINDAQVVGKVVGKSVKKMPAADQQRITKNTEKKEMPASHRRNAEDDTDVTLLTALIQSTKQSTESSASAKKAPDIAE